MLPFAIEGALRPTLLITWLDANNIPVNLTGATITGKIFTLYSGETRAIAGALMVTDGAAGVFSWEYNPTDVATPGRYKVQFEAAYGTEPTPAKTVITDWEVKESL